LNQKLRTAILFAKNLFTTGALAETSRRVEIEICKFIDQKNDLVVVEFGMGHGNITKEILSNLSPNSKVFGFEINKDFCDFVQNNLFDSRLQVINDSAENVKKYISKDVDYIVASLPFSFFSKEKSYSILSDSYDVLKKNGIYSQVLYTVHNRKKFQNVFDECSTIKLSSFPPEYIYHCRKLK